MFLPALIQAPPALPFVSNVFSSHMVLQRGKPNTFWGWTKPGERVTVSIEGTKASGVADRGGKWSVKIQPPRVGGPYRVMIDGSQHVVLEDVLVGDVWLCTGQSNMEMGITTVNEGAETVASANVPSIRLFMAPKQIALRPVPLNGGTWAVCTPESVAKGGWGGFSAVGFFFGRKLLRETGVPIGLIADNWGGTNAESWMSRESADRLGDFRTQLLAADTMLNTTEPYPARLAKWFVENDPGSKPGSDWSKEWAVTDWKAVNVADPFTPLGMGNADGTVWVKNEFTLTEAQAKAGGTLYLGQVDDADKTWINGTLVGETPNIDPQRVYKFGPGVLRAGKNSLVMRVLDTGGPGGLYPDRLRLSLDNGDTLPLGTGWVAKAGADFAKSKPFPVNASANPNIPTVLSNGMIEPIVPLAFKGAIWYQGENNAGRAYQYRRVLPAMIQDWRNRFGQGDFPFYIVSLAAFMAHRDAPSDDNWAELREAQAMTATGMKNSGLAIAIDAGDAADIHPRDKRTVGERLARIALARDYGKNVVYQGPTYRSIQVKGSEAILTFDHAAGLTAKGGTPAEFSVCGADRKWYWATARIEGEKIVVSAPQVSKPVAVRYAWQANPVANLYNAAGLPMVPFRTDQFPGITVNNK